jgi:hypothetical protein
MKRDYRSRLARLEKAAQSRRASIPPITFSTSPEAVALRRELLEIAIRLTPERGWPDQQAVRQGLLHDDRAREVMCLLAEAEAGLVVTAGEHGPTDELTS